MDMFTKIFRKDENYSKAKLRLKRLKKAKGTFDGFVIAFPDVTPDEILFIKGKWEVLPKKIARGVKIMALNFKDEFKDLLIDYKANAYIMPHRHIIEYEMGRVIKGSVTNKLTGETYNEGDEYRFSPNEIHYLLSSKNGCLVHSILTTKENHILKKLSQKTLKRLQSA